MKLLERPGTVRTTIGTAQTSVREQAVICQVLHGLRVGGAEVLAAGLARRFRRDFRFLFICLDELGSLGEELQREGFPVWVLGRRPRLDWRCSWSLAKLLRRERVDLLHTHQYTPFFYGLTARLWWRRPPVLFTEHGRWFPDVRRRKRILANRLLLEQRDRVIGVGQTIRQALVANEGIPAHRVRVIYNGIDLTRFANADPHREAIRREISVGSTDFLILQVARLDALKDHATALRTLERLVPYRADVRLILVGEGPEQGAIQAMIHQRNLGAHVRLLGLRTDIGRLLAAADVMLLTSVSEGIPLTLLEAMAAAVPVVATRVGGVGEIVDDGVTGLLAPRGDDDILAQGLLRLAQDVELRRQFGRSGRERAFAYFSDEQMHNAYYRLYREMLDD